MIESVSVGFRSATRLLPTRALRPESEDGLGRRSRESDRQVGLEHDDHIGRVLHQPAEAAFALALEEILRQRDTLEGEADLRRERSRP